MSKPEYRNAERNAYCRVCDRIVVKGSPVVFFYSWRNRGQNINICPTCVKQLYNLLPKEKI